MTAVIAWLGRDCGYLAADQGAWGPDGRIIYFESKLVHVAAAQTVLAVQGTYNPDLFYLVVMAARDLRDLHDRIIRYMGRNLDEVATHAAAGRWPGATGQMRVTGVSWFEDAPALWGIFHDLEGPLEPKNLGSFYLGPLVNWSEAVGRRIDTAESVATLSPQDALAIMEAQRQQLEPDQPAGVPLHIVGGGCDVAQIDAAGVSIDTLKLWPDVIGERISA